MPTHRIGKSVRNFLIALLILIFLGLYQLIILLIGHPLLRMSYLGQKDCSWIKEAPFHWTCFDNWDYDHRVNIVSNENSYLRLDIGEKSSDCISLLPISFFESPSASGL